MANTITLPIVGKVPGSSLLAAAATIVAAVMLSGRKQEKPTDTADKGAEPAPAPGIPMPDKYDIATYINPLTGALEGIYAQLDAANTANTQLSAELAAERERREAQAVELNKRIRATRRAGIVDLRKATRSNNLSVGKSKAKSNAKSNLTDNRGQRLTYGQLIKRAQQARLATNDNHGQRLTERQLIKRLAG